MFSRLRNKKANLPAKNGQDIFLTFKDVGSSATTAKIVSKGHFDLSPYIPRQDIFMSSIIVTSPGACIEEGMEIGFTLFEPGTIHGTDFVSLTNYLINPSTAVVDIRDEKLSISPNLIVTFDSPVDSLIYITFVTRSERIDKFLKILEHFMKT